MLSQDACAYYDDQVLIPFGGKTKTRGWGRSEGQGLTTRNHLFAAGAVFDNAEGTRIASFVGPDKKVAILQNHGIVSLGRLSIDEAAWWCVAFTPKGRIIDLTSMLSLLTRPQADQL